ncbi:MAG: nickel-responsive transcriptional regulator NikR [Opitutales bacterium]|nr:nickel-responsive transcriptional regulator NikR [Opitutales bacterium]MCH8539447.1 nickel-responsive transcriptional regulator NikR [Opitutales bacterium]
MAKRVNNSSTRADALERISMTLPGNLLEQLDHMVNDRGLPNRSHAVAEMIQREVTEWQQELGEHLMTGTITLFYDASRRNLQNTLADIQRRHIDEVISSHHVQLEDYHTMEVILIQGPARKLRMIADEMISCKGVKSGSLNLISQLIPPLHNRR